MNIYVFGNPDVSYDTIALSVAKRLRRQMQKVHFIIHNPHEDLAPQERDLIIMDCAQGIKKVVLIEDLDALALTPSATLHDFDITFQLKLLKKIGKIDTVKIIAIPQDMDVSLACKQVKEILHRLTI